MDCTITRSKRLWDR